MSTVPEDDPLTRTVSLIEHAKAGDPAARQELVIRYQEQLRRCLHGRLSSDARRLQETHDVVQEALSACLRQLDRFEYRGIGAFWCYLRRIGINLVHQENRKAALHPFAGGASAHLHAAASGKESPSAFLQSQEVGVALEQALERIPEPVRGALLLRIELDLPYPLIAEDCGFASADAARMAICRALEQLARHLATFVR